MEWIIACVLLITAVFFALSYICYRMAFSVPDTTNVPTAYMPTGEQYDSIKEISVELIKSAERLPYEEVYIKTASGLRLFARLYMISPDAPLQIMFHGYRSPAIRDFSGGMQLALECGCNVLLVDQRAHGKSEGRCLSFGINERDDCAEWVKYAVNRFGDGVKIILTGISMGAATVHMASSLTLPENVIGIIGDCGYSSPSAIIKKVIIDLHYPPAPAYFFVRMGGIFFGGFDISRHSVSAELSKTNLPVLFIHGEDDRFVPCEMSLENYQSAGGEKYLLTVPNAGHGISYLVDYDAYRRAIRDFLCKVGAFEANAPKAEG